MLNKYILIKILFSYLFFIMKKVLPLVAVLAAWSFVLTWCNTSVEVTPAEETPVVEESTPKTSLDLWGLISATENNFPKSYTYSKFNMSGNVIEDEWKHIYSRMELWYLTPEYSNIVDREVMSSGIEDGMIYTLVKATLDTWKTVEILYINNPETLDFVAATVEDWDLSTNYQFSYEDITSLTYEDIESIASTDFPMASTYTKFDISTNESTTWENKYNELTAHTLATMTPNSPSVKSAELLSSGIEDGMIYTDFDVVFDDDSTWNALYINDPETLSFVAATIDQWTTSVNYQYVN